VTPAMPAGEGAHGERPGEPTSSAPDVTARSACPDASASPHAPTSEPPVPTPVRRGTFAHRGVRSPPSELGRPSGVLGRPVHDPIDLYAAECAASPSAAPGVPITVPSEESP